MPGFYDDVRPLDPAERAALNAVLPWAEAEWRAVARAPQPWGEAEYTLHERTSARPTLEINGIAGGFYGEGFKTVLPARALAKISCRLVPDQQPARIYELVRDHIARITPPTVRSAVRLVESGAPGLLIDRDAPAMRAAAAAYEKGWGRCPIFMREGGSVPIAATFQRALDADLVFMPFGYKGCGAHGPNEHVYIEMFHKGIDTAIYFMQEIGAR
ncbi:MAG: M20/M25/M40 family metallo-hydrolase [Anaerolineae bacterium]|nr:M20/M25/M40 family metallo-hydrolase [Anaerolineae bacterium]